MNLQEFAALKVGDRVKNNMSNGLGEVTDVDATGLRIKWIGAGMQVAAANAPTWHYAPMSTTYFHWSKVENESPNPETQTA